MGFTKASPMDDKQRLNNLYSVMQSLESKLGGGEGVQGIYGSITQMGMQSIYECMQRNCNLDKNSVLVDIGAGLGRPLLHALLAPAIRAGFGIELDEVKVQKARAFLQQSLGEMMRRGVCQEDIQAPEIYCTAVEQVATLEPATHAYSFWEGVPHEAREAFGKLFAQSRTIKAVTVVQRGLRNEDPAAMMRSYGFGPLLLVKNFCVKMSGSGRSFQAYIFCKISSQSADFMRRVLTPLAPAQPAGTNQDDSSDESEDVAQPAALQLGDLPTSSHRLTEGTEASPSKAARAAGELPLEASPSKRSRQLQEQQQGQEQQAFAEHCPQHPAPTSPAHVGGIRPSRQTRITQAFNTHKKHTGPANTSLKAEGVSRRDAAAAKQAALQALQGNSPQQKPLGLKAYGLDMPSYGLSSQPSSQPAGDVATRSSSRLAAKAAARQ